MSVCVSSGIYCTCVQRWMQPQLLLMLLDDTLIEALHLLKIRSLLGGPVLCLETHNRTERNPLFLPEHILLLRALQHHREEAGVNWVR